MTEESATSPSEATMSLSHHAGITAAVAGLFFFLRVLAVARWDWHTATEVAETVEFGDAATILLGTLFAEPIFTGVLIIAVAPLLIVGLIWLPKINRARRVFSSVALGAIAILAASLSISLGAWWIAIGTLLATTVLAVVHVKLTRGQLHRATLTLLRSVGVIGIVGALVMAAGVSTPWVALEQIDTESGRIHGYVLETPSGFLKVLTEDPREVHILLTSTVNSRQVTER